MGRLLIQKVDDTIFRFIENLDDWDAFSFGGHIWRHLYDIYCVICGIWCENNCRSKKNQTLFI